MKTIFLVFVNIFIINKIGSQDKYYNEMKYWVWRDRLVNNFMVPNFENSPGRGIIFKTRGRSYYWEYPPPEETNYFRTYITGGFDISDEGFELGKYLIVLASEWYLLNMSNMPTYQTEIELYWALKTIERLDNDAEKYWKYFWSKGSSTSNDLLNGFMIRDDVFRNFLWYNENLPVNDLDTFYKKIVPFFNYTLDSYFNYKYLNQGKNGREGKYINQNIMLSDGDTILPLLWLQKYIRYTSTEVNGSYPYMKRCEPANGGMSGAEAGLFACYNEYDCKRNKFQENHWTGPEEYSQDNYIGLLMGLVAVKKLVNNNVIVNGYNISLNCSKIIDRIIYSIKKNESYNNNWEIDNPVTGECVKGVYWNKKTKNFNLDSYCNEGGAQAGLYSYAFCKIHELYTTNCDDCHESGCEYPWSGDIGYQFLNTLDGPFLNDNARLLAAILGTISGIKSNERCCQLIAGMNNANEHEFQFLDLLYCCLHGGPPVRNIQNYINTISNTPCPDNQLYNNLLSEMILHNLIKIVTGDARYYYNYSDTINYPVIQWYPHVSYDNNGNFFYDYFTIYPYCNITRSALYNLESSSTIDVYNGENPPHPYSQYSNVPVYPNIPCKANILYSAGRSIHLKPGFKVINGAKFHAFISDYNLCEIRHGNDEVSLLSFPPYLSNVSKSKHYSLLNNISESDTSIIIKNILNDTFHILHKAKIFLYPTYASENLFLNSENNNSNYFVELHDIIGRLILKTMIENNNSVSIISIKNGIYIAKIYENDILVKIQPIFINR